MTKREPAASYEPNPDYSREDWDSVDSPPLTDQELAEFRPLAEAEPELATKLRRARGRQKAPTKDLVSLRLDKDVLARFRETGPGWQRRINETLRKAMGL